MINRILLALLLAVWGAMVLLAQAGGGGVSQAGQARQLPNLVYSTNPAIANFAMGASSPYVFTGSASLGHDNLCIGLNACQSMTDGIGNLGIGHSALAALTTGINNLAVGWDSQLYGSVQTDNVSVGEDALKSIGQGGAASDYNTAIGYAAGYTGVDVQDNAYVGMNTGYLNVSGDFNAYVGSNAGYNNLGSQNVGVGYQAGYFNNSSSSSAGNVFVGTQAGRNTATWNGTRNVFLGYQAGYFETGSNKLIVDQQGGSRTNEANGRTQSLLYGVMGATPSVQTLDVNGVMRSLAGPGTQMFRPSGTIYSEYPNVANGANTNWVSSTAYSLPAGTVGTNEDTVAVEVTFSLSASGDTKAFLCNIGYSAFTATNAAPFTGGSNVISFSSAVVSQVVVIRAQLRRQSSTLLDYNSEAFYTNAGSWQGSSTAGDAMTWANAQNILCAARDQTAGTAGAVTIKHVRYIWQPA